MLFLCWCIWSNEHLSSFSSSPPFSSFLILRIQQVSIPLGIPENWSFSTYKDSFRVISPQCCWLCLWSHRCLAATGVTGTAACGTRMVGTCTGSSILCCILSHHEEGWGTSVKGVSALTRVVRFMAATTVGGIAEPES